MKRTLLTLGLILAGTAAAQSLTVYSSVDQANSQKILAAFTKDTGIQVESVFLSSGPALARIEAEKNNPRADVWFGAPSENHILAKSRGLTQAYLSPQATGLSRRFKDAQGYWNAFYTNPLAIGYRQDLLDRRKLRAPWSWRSLANSGYKGLIQMPSPQSSGTAYAAVVTFVQLFGENQAYTFMKSLNPNIQTYTQSGTAPSGALAIGESPIAIQFSPAFLKLVDEGYPVKIVFPAEGTGYEAAALSIIAGSKNTTNARKLVDWVLSEKGQKAIVDAKTYFYPTRAGISPGKGVPPLEDIPLIQYDDAFAAANRTRLVERWVKEVLGR
jgi:iron(III) transport system substrate-binding protein